jgi:hypothetical protein
MIDAAEGFLAPAAVGFTMADKQEGLQERVCVRWDTQLLGKRQGLRWRAG